MFCAKTKAGKGSSPQKSSYIYKQLGHAEPIVTLLSLHAPRNLKKTGVYGSISLIRGTRRLQESNM